MQTVLIIGGLIAVSCVIMFVTKHISRGENRLISGGAYKLEKELTKQVLTFTTSVDAESVLSRLSGLYPQKNSRLALKTDWICERNGNVVFFAYGVVDMKYAHGTISHVKAGVRADAVEGGAKVTFNFISWTQSDGVCPHTKQMVMLTETLKAWFKALDANSTVTVSVLP